MLKFIRILKCFLRSITDFYFSLKIFFTRIQEESITKDIRNLYGVEKLDKETNGVGIKGIRTLFRLNKK